MEHTATEWLGLVGKFVILNSFAILQIQGVDGDHLLVGDAGSTTSIPLAVVRTVQPLENASSAGTELSATAMA